MSPGIDQGYFRLAWPTLLPNADFIPVGPWNADGLIAIVPLLSSVDSLSSAEPSRYVHQLIAEGYPVVFAGAGERGPSVVADNEGGIREAMAHLVEHGHRRIAFIAGHEADVNGDSGRRLNAYHAAVQEYGLEADPNLIAYGAHVAAGGHQAMVQILGSGASFTAVLASNDNSALGAMQALDEAGLRVPHDVAVIGFDDRLDAAAHVPSLTTIRYPAFEEGYEALRLLLEYIEGRAEGFQTVRVPTRLILRESCGCLPGFSTIRTLESLAQPGAQPSLDAASAAQSAPVLHVPESRQPSEEVSEIASQLEQAMIRIMSAEARRLDSAEVHRSCQRWVRAFMSSLERGDSAVFHRAVQQVLQRVAVAGDDPHAWQAAISILRDNTPALLGVSPCVFERRQVEDMLDQARLAISEAAQRQHTRHSIRQANIADLVGQMTARFLSAQDEAEIFDTLAESLPAMGIQHAAVAFYEPEGDDPAAWSVLQTPHARTGRRHFPSRQFPPDGLYPQDRPFSLALLPLLVRDDLSGFVAFDAGNLDPCADIVRQLGAALRIVWLYRRAVEGQRLAEEANRLKSRFLSMVSHELRTPLNLIAGLSDMLLREGKRIGSEECRVSRRDVERIYVGAQHLDSLIRDVLDLARSDVGQLKLVCQSLDLVEVLQSVSMIGEQLARDKELAWCAEIPASLPQVWGDRTRLRQVVLNLVNNAVKFTARGEVALTAAVEDGNVIVAVRDTGLGIPADEHGVIFDEFRQSERTAVRGYGGLGLGLAICKRLVEMHGGTIGVRSSGEEGEGSTFYFSLPVMQRQVTCSGAEATPGRHVALLVRDMLGGDMLKEHLTEQGFEVRMYQANESADWLAWLLLTPPEMVVLDLGLTAERGWEILKILKENPVTHDVPVLFYRLAKDGRCGSLLEVDYLTKPVGTAELVEALACQELFGRERGDGADRTILIADDEPGVLEMHARIVEAQSPGCRVIRAANGLEALEAIRQHRPALVLLDLMMPELDGFGVLEAMREDEVNRNIPVIVLTGQTLTEEAMARLNRGVAAVLQKGLFTVEETLERMTAVLERKRRSGSETQRAVLKAMAYIHDHYSEPISRSDVAAYVGLSERHLTRCFRQETGLTPIEYLNRYRVKRAKALLEAGDRSVTQVAMEVGFSTSGYFTRVFRQEVGVSPRAYRRTENDGLGRQ
jgi:signal transduction histidine kinase/DNA-binding response OmpR family regulator